MQLQVSEPECEVLEDVLRRTLGDLRATLDSTSVDADEDRRLEQREYRVGRLLTRIASRRPTWRAECAALDGLVGPERR
jgi:hypothetical protein